MAAKKRRTSTKVPAAQTVVVLDQDTKPAPRRRRRSRRRSGGGGSAASTKDLGKDAMAGVAYGLVERLTEDMDLPEIPVIGRKGSLALALYMLRKYHPIVNDAARAGVIICTYELASEGKITGE